MQHLNELPDGTIWPHLLTAIERDVLTDLHGYVESRLHDVARGAETAELAAVLVDKYCDGLAKALRIAGLESSVRAEGDRLVRVIDPDFENHRKSRWAARPAALSMGAAASM